MAEAVGLEYLVGDEKLAFERRMWERFEVPGRLITLAASVAICIADRTLIWLHTDVREMQGRQEFEIDKPRTLPRQPKNDVEALILQQTFGPSHPLSGKVGSILRRVAADEWYAYISGPRDPQDPRHMWFVGGYRPEFRTDVDHMLGVVSSRKGREIIEGREPTHPSLTGRPQLGGYKEKHARSDEAVERRAAREWNYYYLGQSRGGASPQEDRRIVASTLPTMLSAVRHHNKAKRHNTSLAAALVAAATVGQEVVETSDTFPRIQ